MKKIIAIITALVLVLSLTACMGGGAQTSGSSSDQAKPVSEYTKDFDGLKKYIADRNTGGSEADVFYTVLGADNGKRYILNGNAYVEIYDFSSTKGGATADQAAENQAQKAKDAEDFFSRIEDGKIRLFENSTLMTAVITNSGKYVLLWDETRGYDYSGSVATDELKKNW